MWHVQVIAQAYPWLETYSLQECEGMLARNQYGHAGASQR